MRETLAKHEIVLLGIGHTNAHVLRMWRMRPLRDARLTCISNFSTASYSGMLPGVLAGQYPPQRMEIDLVRLTAAANARFVHDTVVGIDHERQEILFADRPALRFDVLSIGIGSIPSSQGVSFAGNLVLPIKPMQTFLDRLEQRVEQLRPELVERPLRATVVGGGLGGIEIALCLPRALARMLHRDGPNRSLTPEQLQLRMVHGGNGLGHGLLPGTAEQVRQQFVSRGVEIVAGNRVVKVDEQGLLLDDDRHLPADIVFWATGATAPPLLGQLGLPTDERGFLLTEANLRTVTDAPIFVVGDSGTIRGSKTPKAGVYAVRQGPVLWENMARSLERQPLQDYVPQRGFLKLINTGDGKAIAEYAGRSFRSALSWKLKDWIDGRFMDKYQDYEPMAMSSDSGLAKQPVMRCAGCGGKISGSVLSKVLARLDVPFSPHVLLGLEAPDDAAVVQSPHGNPMTVTTDFFAAPLDDPYLVGRLAALNSASDAFAMGAQPLAALAMATLPVGPPQAQEHLLYELLAGSLEELRAMGATLVGGHTIEGPQLTLGFTILADQGKRPPQTKGMLRVGDQLVLTKPLGTGVLLAAHMQARCRAEWMEVLLETMLLRNQLAAQLLDQVPEGIGGLTDVTGFGLAGHLLEMLRSAGATARLDLQQIPLLPGTEELIAEGLESTLAPANRAAEMDIHVLEVVRRLPAYAALFDPQTCGGMLLAVAPDHVPTILDLLRTQSPVPAAVIGEVLNPEPDEHSLRVV